MTMRETVSIAGIDISYLRAGDGPPVVLLHGIGGNATQFRHQIDALADNWTLVAWDAPGYGGSADPGDGWQMTDYAAALAGLLDALGLTQVNLLGQSWGGVLAQIFIGQYPERVRVRCAVVVEEPEPVRVRRSVNSKVHRLGETRAGPNGEHTINDTRGNRLRQKTWRCVGGSRVHGHHC